MGKQSALVIEDDVALSRTYNRLLVNLGYRVTVAHSITDARPKIRDTAPSLILVDIELPDGNGLDLMNEMRTSTRERFIVISGNTSQRAAIKSIRHRAVEFVTKPVSLVTLKQLIGQAISDPGVSRQENLHQTPGPASQPDTENCWINHGECPALAELRTAISFSAELRSGHALIIGEPGLEKRSIASEVHRRSRRQGKIVFLNCKDILPGAQSTALFGSNNSRETGYLERAAGGTLVLENISLLSGESQSALRFFMDTGSFKRHNGNEGIRVQLAIIGILQSDSDMQSLKPELTAQLSAVTLDVPSLRDCDGDIVNIAEWLLSTQLASSQPVSMSEAMKAEITTATWTDNIRELKLVLKKALEDSISSQAPDGQLCIAKPLQDDQTDAFPELVGLSLHDFSQQYITKTLALHKGDKNKTARTLGISLKTLYNRLNSQ